MELDALNLQQIALNILVQVQPVRHLGEISAQTSALVLPLQ